jgi:DNA-binding protein HU-beta
MTASLLCLALLSCITVAVLTLTPARSAIYTPRPFKATSIQNGTREPFVNKNDLVDAIAASGNMTKADATQAVDAVIDAITNALKGGEEVRIAGFGTFVVSQRAASEGRNPRTGEKIQIPASKLPKFRAGKGLKDAIQ